MELKIKMREVEELLQVTHPTFPKYVTQLLNLANQNAQATRPKVVGQMSQLVEEFPGKSLSEWEEWYLTHYADKIEEATDKIIGMLNNFKKALQQIDREIVRKWVKDLVITKSFVGLKFQLAIFKVLAKEFQLEYRLATPAEERRGIDGYLGEIPISLKPTTYRSQQMLPEQLEGYPIYYQKEQDGIRVIIPPEVEKVLSQQKPQ